LFLTRSLRFTHPHVCSSGDATARLWRFVEDPTDKRTSLDMSKNSIVLKHFADNEKNREGKDVTTLDWNVRPFI
jgi:hypothetical protein